MSKWVVGIMILVVIAMFWKGVEVLGPSNTNRDVLYEGPKKSVKRDGTRPMNGWIGSVKINPNNLLKRELNIDIQYDD